MPQDDETGDRPVARLDWETAEKDLREFIVDMVGGEAWKIEIVERDPDPDWPAHVPAIRMAMRGPEDVMRKFSEAFAEWSRSRDADQDDGE